MGYKPVDFIGLLLQGAVTANRCSLHFQKPVDLLIPEKSNPVNQTGVYFREQVKQKRMKKMRINSAAFFNWVPEYADIVRRHVFNFSKTDRHSGFSKSSSGIIFIAVNSGKEPFFVRNLIRQ